MDLADIVSKAAPILGGFLAGGPVGAGAAALKLVASEFGAVAEPDAVTAAIQADPDAAVKLRQIELDHKTELQRLLIENEARQQAEVNASMRAEAAADDGYVRRWRPTIGYVVAFQFGLLGLAVFAGVIGAIFAADAEQSTAILSGLGTLIGSMTVIIASEAAMLGVNITQRSRDKAVSAGHPPQPGILAALTGRVG
ncbi:MAG: hypothetical protein HQL35_10730 [Alphaproteobacteria bacterium]|nr:hypothetical protein [Alphaproteobacteria bacterium]